MNTSNEVFELNHKPRVRNNFGVNVFFVGVQFIERFVKKFFKGASTCHKKFCTARRGGHFNMLFPAPNLPLFHNFPLSTKVCFLFHSVSCLCRLDYYFSWKRNVHKSSHSPASSLHPREDIKEALKVEGFKAQNITSIRYWKTKELYYYFLWTSDWIITIRQSMNCVTCWIRKLK